MPLYIQEILNWESESAGESCMYGDYWVGAVKMFADQGLRLPTVHELTKLAQYLCNDSALNSDKKF